jgi:hypothetical protein
MKKTIEEILKTEYSVEFDKLRQTRATTYSERFDELRKNRVCEGYYKYGPARDNAPLTDNLKNAARCLVKYNETGNTEYLVDRANYLMFEFMYPQSNEGEADRVLADWANAAMYEFMEPTRGGAYFEATPSEQSAGREGVTIRELEAYREGGSY